MLQGLPFSLSLLLKAPLYNLLNIILTNYTENKNTKLNFIFSLNIAIGKFPVNIAD